MAFCFAENAIKDVRHEYADGQSDFADWDLLEQDQAEIVPQKMQRQGMADIPCLCCYSSVSSSASGSS